MKLFHLKMITPDNLFFEGEVQSVNIDTPDGRRGFLAEHIQMVCALTDGEITVVDESGTTHEVACGTGFVEMMEDGLLVASNMLIAKQDLNEELIRKEIEKIELEKQRKLSIEEYKLVKMSLARAFAKLKTYNGTTKK